MGVSKLEIAQGRKPGRVVGRHIYAGKRGDEFRVSQGPEIIHGRAGRMVMLGYDEADGSVLIREFRRWKRGPVRVDRITAEEWNDAGREARIELALAELGL